MGVSATGLGSFTDDTAVLGTGMMVTNLKHDGTIACESEMQKILSVRTLVL